MRRSTCVSAIGQYSIPGPEHFMGFDGYRHPQLPQQFHLQPAAVERQDVRPVFRQRHTRRIEQRPKSLTARWDKGVRTSSGGARTPALM